MPPRITIEPDVVFTPGTQFGRYRIDAMIGAGGMGEVYRAYDTTLRRPLAIKVLREGSRSGPDHQLLREAQSASALNHAAICTVYEIGAEQGSAFIAMEYVDGESLAAKIARGPLEIGDVVRWGMDVADALSHAHERGVIHRDLKAANVIVSTQRPAEDRRLRPGAPARCANGGGLDRGGRHRSGPVPRARLTPWPPNRSGRRPSIAAPTSGRSASCCTRWSRAVSRSPATAWRS